MKVLSGTWGNLENFLSQLRDRLIDLNRGITKFMHALKDIIGNSVKEGRIEEHKDWSPGDYLGPDCHRTK